MIDETALRRIAFPGIATGFVVGIAQACLDTSQKIGAPGYSRILIVSLMATAFTALISWLARIAIVGRIAKDFEPSLPRGAMAAGYFVTALNFGLLCVFAPALVASIAGWLIGWDAGELVRALIGLVLLVALFGTARDSIFNLALIANRSENTGSRPIEPNDI